MKARTLTRETILNIDITAHTLPSFKVGDTISVGQLIKEGDKERVQLFEGSVIAAHQNGVASTFTVRRIGANGIGVEKIFPYHSPLLKDVQVIKVGKVRRAKLFYVRERLGKAAKIKERILTKEQKDNAAAAKKLAA